MKTTVESSDSLLAAARRRAQAGWITLGSVVEDGLRRVLSETPDRRELRLRRATFAGDGRTSEA